jgi:hypothetical protein
MRVSSLSDDRVIGLVSRHFVPVWLSRDGYQLGPRPKGERDEMLRIDRERQQRGLEGGSVCVYILRPDGSLLSTLPVQKAARPENLVPFLKAIVEKERFEARRPDSVRASAAPRAVRPRPAEEGGMVLHVLTRFDERRTNYGVSEDWLTLTAEEARAFVPADGTRAGSSYEVPAKVADRLFLHFYPPGPNWRAKDGTVIARSLTATVEAVSAKEVRVRLRGTVELSHPFGAGKAGRASATLVGVLRADPARRTVTSFLMASEEAKYAWEWKGRPQPEKMVIVVEMEPPP